MKKRLLSIMLVLVFAISATVPAFATSFSDLSGHWAKEYMEDLADRGYLSGYSDGTMKPDKNITACETLVLLSRFYDLKDETKDFIYTDYGDFVEDTAASSVSWAYDELTVCLAAGIITESELKSIDLTAEIKKEMLATFVVRAMQLEGKAETLEDTQLSFKDAADISDDCVGSVAELVSLAIVTGDDNNNFTPKLSVTRAVVATMISRSLDYLEKEDKTLAIEAYDGLAKTTGIITSVSSGNVDVLGFDGLTREYYVPNSASVKVNGTEKTLSSIYKGCYVDILAKKGSVSSLNIDSDADVVWVQGAIYSVATTSSSGTLNVTDLSSAERTKCAVTSDADITKDGKTVAFSALVKKRICYG